MISRYTSPEFAILWSDQTKYETWLSIEIEVCRSMEKRGMVPPGTTAKIEGRTIIFHPKTFEYIRFDLNEIARIEKTTRHDLVAFTQYIERLVGPEARWLHCGLTSSDITDTGLSKLLDQAACLLNKKLHNVIWSLQRITIDHVYTPVIGRSHGMHAEPTTFGVILAGYLAEFKRCLTRLKVAQSEITYGKISGAVGTFVHLSPEIEREVLQNLGLKPETVSTQVIPRDRHAHFFITLALIAATIERFATNMRHWQRTEVGEVSENFALGQKGSSAMPHKRNPITSENLCGLARMVRSAVTPALENISLWHERDISHSSVERMIAPDTTSLLGYMLDKVDGLINNLSVNADRMNSNLDLTNGLFYSESVLLALVKSGMARHEAYPMVQSNAMTSLTSGKSFRGLILSDVEIGMHLTQDQIRECFDIKQFFRWSAEIVDSAVQL